MPGEDNLGPVVRDRAGALSDSLLLEILNRIGVIEKQNERNVAQNENILAGQARAEESRGSMHSRINEISINVAEVAVRQEEQDRRLDVLDPIVASLRDAQIERNVIRKVIGAVVRNGYARAGGAVIAASGAAWHWDSLVAIVRKLVGAKVGGP